MQSQDEVNTYPYVLRGTVEYPARKGKPCRILTDVNTTNTGLAQIQFEDGFVALVPRQSVRRGKEPANVE